jgi:hypothetical protein
MKIKIFSIGLILISLFFAINTVSAIPAISGPHEVINCSVTCGGGGSTDYNLIHEYDIMNKSESINASSLNITNLQTSLTTYINNQDLNYLNIGFIADALNTTSTDYSYFNDLILINRSQAIYAASLNDTFINSSYYLVSNPLNFINNTANNSYYLASNPLNFINVTYNLTYQNKEDLKNDSSFYANKTYEDSRAVINNTYDTIQNRTLNIVNGSYQTIQNQSPIDNLQTANELLDFRNDATRPLTGTSFFRDIDTSWLEFAGGSNYNNGAFFSLFGRNFSVGGYSGYIYLRVPDASSSWITGMKISGNTNTPQVYIPYMASSAQSSAVCFNSGTGQLTYNSGVTTCAASSEQYKNNISYLTSQSVIFRVMGLKPAYYNLLIDKNTPHYGLIAEDVAKIFPELVGHNPDGSLSGVRYDEFTAVLVKSIQEEENQIIQQNLQISNLTLQINNLNNTIAQICANNKLKCG